MSAPTNVAGAGASRTGRQAWERLVTLSWSHLLNDGASNYLPGVLPAVLVSLDEPVRMAGGLMAVLIAGQTLQPVAGWLADRYGGRSMVAMGLALTTIGGGLLGLVHSTTLLIVVLAFIGAGGALFHPQALASLRSMPDEHHGLVTSMFLVGGEIGRGIWPTLAGATVSAFGLESLWILAIPGVLTLPVLFHLTPVFEPKPPSSVRIDWWGKRRSLGLLVGYRSIQALIVYAFATFIPIRWHDQGGSLISGASIITTMITVGIVGNLAGGHFTDRIGRRPVMIVSAIAAAVWIIPVTFAAGPWLWVSAAFLGMSLFLATTATILIGQDLFPDNTSMGSGIALGFTNGIGALALFAIGSGVSEHAITDLFLGLAILSILSIGFVIALPSDALGSGHLERIGLRR